MQKTLLVMAAGMGSRFGGLKQIEPMGPNGEFLIDYSIYDAKLAGFTKVVFIIKEENYNLFKETVALSLALTSTGISEFLSLIKKSISTVPFAFL